MPYREDSTFTIDTKCLDENVWNGKKSKVREEKLEIDESKFYLSETIIDKSCLQRSNFNDLHEISLEHVVKSLKK